MTPRVRSAIILSLLSSSITAYVPSVHPHDHSIVAIQKPGIVKPTSIVEEPSHEPDTTTSSNFMSVSRTKWGTDYEHPEEYWFDERIHTLGNHGFGGAIHAALAPLSTKIIDLAAYRGEDVRLKVSPLSFVSR